MTPQLPIFHPLQNMFLAIIADSYSEVKSELRQKPAELEMLDIVNKVKWQSTIDRFP